jgi:TatD DNase family protein
VIDTHAHLDALEDPAVALDRARAAGVERVVAIGSGLESAKRTTEIAAQARTVSVAVGIHPHQAGDGESLDALRVFAAHAVAIGEIGLDFYRDYAPRDAQQRVFEAQLQLAAELEKPVIIHTRAADEETARMLEGFSGTVIMHCFSTPDLLPIVLERGYYVSFAGNVTYPKAEDLRAAAAQIPADRLLAETDSPYLAPQPLRGKRNEPAYIVHTYAALGEARGEDAEYLERQIDRNADAAFSLS